MIPYITVFLLTVLFAWFADMTFAKKKWACVAWLTVIVILNTVFCGARDFGIGIDTTIYIDSYFTDAGFVHKFKDILWFEGDKGFLIFAMITHLFSNDSQSLLFSVALLIFVFQVWGCYRYKRLIGLKIWIYMFFFCFVFFCHSINLMRQYCAMSLLFVGFSYFIDKKYIGYVILQVVAYFFHSSSIFFLVVPFIWLMSQMESVRTRNWLTVVGIIILCMMLSSYFYFVEIVGNLGIVAEKYSDVYGKGGKYVNEKEARFGIRAIAYQVYPLFIILLAWWLKVLKNKTLYLIFVLYVFTTLIFQIAYLVNYMGRLAHYSNMIYFAFLTIIYASKKMPWPALLVGGLLLIDQWYGIFIRGIGGNVYPYTSKILGILGI